MRFFAAASAVALSACCLAEPVTVRFATSAGGENLKLLNRQVAEFEALHPDIHIKLEPIVDNYEDKLLAEFAANVAPDCAGFDANRIVKFSSLGVLKPLNEFGDLDSPE